MQRDARPDGSGTPSAPHPTHPVNLHRPVTPEQSTRAAIMACAENISTGLRRPIEDNRDKANLHVGSRPTRPKSVSQTAQEGVSCALKQISFATEVDNADEVYDRAKDARFGTSGRS